MKQNNNAHAYYGNVDISSTRMCLTASYAKVSFIPEKNEQKVGIWLYWFRSLHPNSPEWIIFKSIDKHPWNTGWISWMQEKKQGRSFLC